MEYIENSIHLDKTKFLKAKGKVSFANAAKLSKVSEGTLFRAYYKQNKLNIVNARKLKDTFGDVLFIKEKKIEI